MLATQVATRFGLSPREQETVELVLRGLSDAEAAERMKVTHHTVRTFLWLVMVKMDVASRSEIIAKISDTGAKRVKGWRKPFGLPQNK